MIAEDVPDKFNRYVRQNAGAINPVVRQICSLHIVDEARHIAAARSRLESALRGGSGWRLKSVLKPVMNLLFRQLVDTFYVPPASFYELAGLTHGEWWRKLARGNAVHPIHRAMPAPTLRMLEGYGLKTPGWPLCATERQETRKSRSSAETEIQSHSSCF